MGALTVSSQISPILSMIRTKFPNYHPLMSIAEIADTTEDLKLQFECHKTIAKYVEPELKSLEVKAPIDPNRGVKVSLFDVIDAEYHQLPEPA